MKAGEHGPDKLYDKFVVCKSKHATIDPDMGCVLVPIDKRLGAGKEFLFVLRPETDDDAAIAALHTYAEICERTYPGLAHDIREQLLRISNDEA